MLTDSLFIIIKIYYALSQSQLHNFNPMYPKKKKKKKELA